MTEISTLKIDLPDGLVTSTTVFRDEVTLHTTREKLLDLLQNLKDVQQFNMLTDITCADYLPKEPRFGMVYQLNSLARNIRVRVKVMLSEYDPRVPSACAVYINANWLEREIYDLMGILFDGHPDLRRILLPLGYEGHPLRRDIPVNVEENAFSFNRERIDREKPYATE
jgi:NADH-quinone oxidoreductase subunit C